MLPEIGPASGGDVQALAQHARHLAITALAAVSRTGDEATALEGPLADLALCAYLADSSARAAAISGEAALLCAAAAVERAHAAYGQVAACLAGLPTRGLSLLDVAPRLDRSALRRSLARAALAVGRDPLVTFDPIRPPAPGEAL
jgi:hypothetical protein